MEKLTLKGTLINDHLANSKNNWLFYEKGTNKAFLVCENQTDLLNKMVLNKNFFYSTVFDAKLITEHKVQIELTNKNK
jgi:hypothetical protein